jgi:outer membrane protein OmpA-like peptidoglycan-associated protein
MKMRSIGHLVVLSSVVAAAACSASLPPKDLLTARANYERADKGPAHELDPADLHSAREQLNVAEAAFKNDGDTQNTRDQAYLAARKSQLAEVVAHTMQTTQTKDGVVNAMHADEKQAVAKTSAELGRTKSALASQGATIDAQGVALGDEKARREDAERRAMLADKRAAAAAADLAKFASVKQEARGMVITLSGSVLFASAKWDLLPAAQLKLNEVANALTKEDPVSKMVVEGHTDSQGAAAYNQELSQHRAQAVRDYLVTRGIAADRITAQGFGPTRSVADNASAEGRANNRRVEIVVQPAANQ